MIVTAAQLAPIQTLYDRGLFLQAWQQAQAATLPPVGEWRGAAGRILAGRLATRLGAPRLAAAIFDRARREAPVDARARCYWLYSVAAQRGVFVAWRQLHAEPITQADAETHADLALLRAVLLASFRDFTAANDALAEAASSTPDSAFVLVQTAVVLAQQDRYDEALAVAQQALKLSPDFVPAIGQAAHLMQLLARDGDACALLQGALTHIESFDLAVALSLLQSELDNHAGALAATERALALAPLAEPELRRWAAARRCDLCLRLGDHATARIHAEAADSPFHTTLAARLARPEAHNERVVLSVPFVRQHHMTCGPATLVALAACHGRAIDHLQVADEICYGGTTAANARRWAIRNGFVAREFTFNADDAQALLRRGVPIAVTTAEATSAHLQAVIGFDTLRGTLVVRDPFTRNTREWLTDEFLAAYRACGPRALLLLPQENASPITDLRLRDEALHDDDFAIQEALLAHDHTVALARYEGMLERDPDHLLTIQARWALSAYERDPVGTLACIERLLALFPGDQRLLLRKVWCLAELEQTAERMTLLDALARRPGNDPVFCVVAAEERRTRAYGARDARCLLHRALRRRPSLARAHHALGLLAWQVDDALAAHQHLRFAACLDDTDDDYATAYTDWCRAHDRAASGLTFVRARHDRWRRQAAGPTLVLHQTLLALHRDADARAVLAGALAERPEDGNLLLAAAREAVREGDLGAAESFLHKAEGKAFETRRVAALADLADRAGDRDRALRCWQSILQREPLNQSARAMAFELTEALHGRAAAISELQVAAGELPFARPLRRYVAYQVGRDDAAAATTLLQQIVADDPADAWAQRELARKLAAQGHLAPAIARAKAACMLDPERADSHSLVGHLLALAGETAAARASLLTALDRDLDDAPAVEKLATLATDAGARRALLEDLAARFSRRGSGGPGLRAFARIAAKTLPAGDVRGWLEAVWKAQPNAQAAGSVLIEHLLATSDVATARQIAERGCERFPLDARSWLDRAAVARGHDLTTECAALERAVKLLPDSAEVAWYLASAYARNEQLDAARAVLERNRERTRDPDVLVLLAELCAESEAGAAVRLAKEALHLDCECDGAWSVLHREAVRAADAGLIAHTARELTRARPHDPRPLLTLARVLREPAHLEERLAALARAIELDPSNPDPYDLRAELLAESDRHADAAAVVAAFPHRPLPASLRGRQAWLTHATGKTGAAIAAMRDVLAEHPFYAWGWRTLLGWLHPNAHHDELGDAADAYLRAWPKDAVAHAWVGEAHMLVGQRGAAKTAFARALSLDAHYAFAADRLFNMHFQDGEFDAADADLVHIENTTDPATTQLRHLQVACAKLQHERARDRLQCLSREHGDATAVLRAAGDALSAAGCGANARGWLRDDLRHGTFARGAAVIWVRTWTNQQQWSAALAALRNDDLTDPGLIHGVDTLIDDLTAAGRARLVRRLLRGKTAARLAAASLCWGKVAWCLNAAACYRRTVRWMADWARADAEPWMLVNLAQALRCLGRFDRAHDVSVAAAALAPQSPATDLHHAWLAYDALVSGDIAAARASLASVNRAALDECERPLVDLVVSLIAAAETPRRGAARARMQRALDAACSAGRTTRTPDHTALRHAVRHAARAAPRLIGAGVWWWHWRYA